MATMNHNYTIDIRTDLDDDEVTADEVESAARWIESMIDESTGKLNFRPWSTADDQP